MKLLKMLQVVLLNLFIFSPIFGNDYKNKHSKPSKNFIRGCYYTNWAQYRHGKGKYLPENYVPGLCTHIFYAFVTMNETFAIRPFEWNDESSEYSKGMFERVNDLKLLQPDLKTLLSFGGWTFSQQNERLLKTMSASPSDRQRFVASALSYTKKHKFDGFDLDWEYPNEDDKANFVLLVKEMSASFRANNLLFTAAVAASIAKIEAGYDVPAIASSLDFVNIMTYDFHGSWENATGFNSPLFDRQNDNLSMVAAVDYWVSKGMPRKKILVGFATYGRSWTLLNPNTENGVYAPASQAIPGQHTREAGFLSYYEVCNMLQNGAKSYFDQIQKVPYAIMNTQWVGYDDVTSFLLKLDWLKENDFGGAFVWTLDLDDFEGTCTSSYNKKFPLISRIARELSSKPFKPVTTAPTTTPRRYDTVSSTLQRLVESTASTLGQSTTSTSQNSQTEVNNKPPKNFQCPATGLFPDPNSCFHFFSCHFTIEAYHMTCGGGLTFNPKTKTCDWPHNTQCPVYSNITG